jgi:hypothetical protein
MFMWVGSRRGYHSAVMLAKNRENALMRLRLRRHYRGPFGFAQGRLFDCVALRFADGNFAQDDTARSRFLLAQDDRRSEEPALGGVEGISRYDAVCKRRSPGPPEKTRALRDDAW